MVVLGVALAVIGVFGVGCSGPRREVVVGKMSAGGGLIFFEWDAGGQKRQAVLKKGYGMMIFYDVFQKDAEPRFELYVHEDRQIIRTKSLSQFKKELARIPPGQRLHYYNTCGGGTHHALDPRFLDEIKTYCRRKGIVFQQGDDELYGICTCL